MSHLIATGILFSIHLLNATESCKENTICPIDNNMNDEVVDKIQEKMTFKLWPSKTFLESSQMPSMKYVKTTLGKEENLKSKWMSDAPLKVIIHGWNIKSDESNSWIFSVKKDYIDNKNKYNIITVDWGQIAKQSYFKAARKCKKVGKIVGQFLVNLLNLSFAKPENIHLIGHSLGAHVAGSAGKLFHQKTDKKIARITGLDPSSPAFKRTLFPFICYEKLKKENAEFVDVIHTTKGLPGLFINIGHADFYPNYSSFFQPGCSSINVPDSLECSHARSYTYYSESISNSTSFLSVNCKIKKFKKGKCRNGLLSNMGHYANPSIHGTFYLRTNSTSPYSVNLYEQNNDKS